MDSTSKLIPPATGVSHSYKDTSTSAHTGTTAATLVKSRTINPNDIPVGEGFDFYCAGTVTGTNGTKLIQMSYGALALSASSQASGEQQVWYFSGRVRRVSLTGWSVELAYTEDGGTKGSESDFHGLGSGTWDIGVTVTLGSASDTVSVLVFRVSPLP